MGKQTEQDKGNLNVSNRLDGLAASNQKLDNDLRKEIDDLKAKVSNQDAEIINLRNGQRVSNIPQNRPMENHDQHAPAHTPPYQANSHSKLNIIIEGLEEKEDEDLMVKVLSLFDLIGAKLNVTEFTSVSRIKRKVPLGKKPNPIKVCFADLGSKELVMSCKYNLRPNEKTRNIWLNHDEAAHIRRSKGRARFIASHARKKGSSAQLTPSGIVLDNVFYTYDDLDRIVVYNCISSKNYIVTFDYCLNVLWYKILRLY